MASACEFGERRGQIPGVPKDDCRDEEIEAGGAIGLVFERAIAKLVIAVEKDRPRERLRASPLLRPRPVRRRNSGSLYRPSMNSDRSIRPMFLSATASPFCRGYPDSFFSMAEARTAPDLIDVTRRRISLQLAAM